MIVQRVFLQLRELLQRGAWLSLFWVALLVGYLALLTALSEDFLRQQRERLERTVQEMNVG